MAVYPETSAPKPFRRCMMLSRVTHLVSNTNFATNAKQMIDVMEPADFSMKQIRQHPKHRWKIGWHRDVGYPPIPREVRRTARPVKETLEFCSSPIRSSSL